MSDYRLGGGAVLLGLVLLSMATCQDDNTKKLVEAMDRMTAALQAQAASK